MTPTHISLRGYAAVYGQTAHISGGKLEQFAPGAFAQILDRPRAIDLRWDTHADDAPRLASSTSGTLSFQFEPQRRFAGPAALCVDCFVGVKLCLAGIGEPVDARQPIFNFP